MTGRSKLTMWQTVVAVVVMSVAVTLTAGDHVTVIGPGARTPGVYCSTAGQEADHEPEPSPPSSDDAETPETPPAPVVSPVSVRVSGRTVTVHNVWPNGDGTTMKWKRGTHTCKAKVTSTAYPGEVRRLTFRGIKWSGSRIKKFRLTVENQKAPLTYP